MASVALEWLNFVSHQLTPACGHSASQAGTIAEALAAGRCDFGFLHIKAVDDTGHDRAAASKAVANHCCATRRPLCFAPTHIHSGHQMSAPAQGSLRHVRCCVPQVKYLEVVDVMVGQLLRRLADAEETSSASSAQQQQQLSALQPAAGGDRPTAGADGAAPASDAHAAGFAVCVTGDHSTPVVFGDHSHEAVPFVVARVSDAVSAMLLNGDTGRMQRGV
jgi:hypothetical protein